MAGQLSPHSRVARDEGIPAILTIETALTMSSTLIDIPGKHDCSYCHFLSPPSLYLFTFSGNMTPYELASFIFLALYPETSAASFWGRGRGYVHRVLDSRFKGQESGTLSNTTAWLANDTSAAPAGVSTPAQSSTFQLSSLTANVQRLNPTVEGIVVTKLSPVYSVCNLPGGSSPGSCSTVHNTITTPSCSIVMTADIRSQIANKISCSQVGTATPCPTHPVQCLF